MFLRGAFGDLGKPSLEASKDGYSVAKAPLAHALRLALNVYSLLQRGEAASQPAPGHDDPVKNNAMMKAAMHFLGADLAGVSAAPPWVWYSHRQDGTEMEVAHDNAVSVMIDQGFEPWVSKALNRDREADFFSKITAFRAGDLRESAVSGDTSFSIWHWDYTHAEWGEVKYDQVAVRRWQDGLIVEERFYRG